jgi:hypothetical protein
VLLCGLGDGAELLEAQIAELQAERCKSQARRRLSTRRPVGDFPERGGRCSARCMAELLERRPEAVLRGKGS